MGTGASKKPSYSQIGLQELDKQETEEKNILTEKVKFLKDCRNYNSHDAFAALHVIFSSYYSAKGDEGKQRLGDHLAEVEFCDVFCKIWKELTKEDLIGDDQNGQACAVHNVLKGATHNFSDASQLLCEELGKSGAVVCLLSELEYPELNYKKIDEEEKNDGKRRRWIKSTLGILHNTIRMSSDNVPIFREAGAVDLLTEYLKCNYLIIRAKALLNLVYIVNEDENDKIMTDGTNISFLVKMLESALESDDHMSSTGTFSFDAEELVDGLNKLAQNDANKVTLVDCGILPLLVKLMKEGKSEEEMRLAALCIWTLAFNDENKEKIRNEPELMEEMKRNLHCRDPEKCGDTCKAIRGGLWVLGEKLIVKESEQLESDSSKRDDGQDVQFREKSVGHVMISYQWDVQKTIIKIKDQLKAKGYKVWMDIEQMEGSTLEAMSRAVENASVILICYTQKYKDSSNCRLEANYVNELQKPIVPLMLQQNFKPDGWLGMLLASKLYFDFSSPSNLDQELPKLVKELGDRGLQSSPVPFIKNQNAIKGVAVPTVGSAPPEVVVPIGGTAQWTNADVNKWLDAIGLGHMKKKFMEYDGEMLMGLKLVVSELPEFFYSSLKSEFGLKKMVDIVRFRSALEKLF